LLGWLVKQPGQSAEVGGAGPLSDLTLLQSPLFGLLPMAQKGTTRPQRGIERTRLTGFEPVTFGRRLELEGRPALMWPR
jgi:hypothetical protein